MGTLLIFGQAVKSQGQIWHSVYKTSWAINRLHFFSQSNFNFTTKLLMMIEMRIPINYGSRVQRPRLKFGPLSIKYRGHDADYSFCLFIFKIHMQVVDDARRNCIDFGKNQQKISKTILLCIVPSKFYTQ